MAFDFESFDVPNDVVGKLRADGTDGTPVAGELLTDTLDLGSVRNIVIEG